MNDQIDVGPAGLGACRKSNVSQDGVAPREVSRKKNNIKYKTALPVDEPSSALYFIFYIILKVFEVPAPAG